MKHPGDRRSLSRSATRALDIMELFGEQRRPLRATDVAKALDLHASTVDQLLKTMVDSAHLLFDARSKTYRPSHRLGRLGAWILSSYGEERLRALVLEVQSATREFVTLTVPNDTLQVVDVAGGWPGDDDRERGLRVSVFGSVIGAAHLSSQDDLEIVRLAGRARLPTAEIAAVFENIAKVRAEGFAEGLAAGGEGAAWTLAVPLTASNVPPMVLGVGGPAERMKANSADLRRLLSGAVSRWIEAPP